MFGRYAACMHTSSEFDDTLDHTHALLLQMAERIERQIDDAVACLGAGSARLVAQVLERDAVINDLARAVDALAGRVIARRDPATADLRMILALIRSTTELERIGDEAKKIALRAKRIADAHWPTQPRHPELATMARLALQSARRATHALERLDPREFTAASARERALGASLQQVMRELINHMIEDPRTISSSLDMMLVAKSLERIGERAARVLELAGGRRS